MDFFANNIFLIMFLPLWICLIIISGAFIRLTENRKMTAFLTSISTLTGLIFSIALFNYVKSPQPIVIEDSFSWLNIDNLNIYLGVLLDSTSAIFLVILMLISLLIQIYSYGYMKNKEEFSKYFIYLNFFNFAMTGLILSPNLIQLYIFWELVGVASYLLIGFFHKKEDVSLSAKKVFIINRFGDTALLAGIIFFAYFSITYMNQQPNEFLAFSDLDYFHNQLQSLTYPNVYNLVLSLFLIGAFVKSAQFPFQQWLIDAMKAPTPVSALIHSATMVCAGIFLIIRIYPLLSDELLKIILSLGLITAVLCAFIAISQNNIKKMLAYSTSSQLGLMFTAIGLQSIPVAIIYLVIHSFTKALLFLCTGNISQISNSIETKDISGLRKIDFYLAIYWIIGALSLSGLFFGGFTSKEMLLNVAENNKSILFLILLTSFMSTFYIFRTYFNIFEGNKREEYKIINERTMSFALMTMVIFVIFPGFLFKVSQINMLCLLAIGIGITAIFSAYFSSKCNKIMIPPLLYKLSQNELFIPNLYNFIGRLFNLIYFAVNIIDKYVIEGFINITVKITKFISNIISKLQNGNIQTYVSYSIFSIGIILLIILYLYFMALRS